MPNQFFLKKELIQKIIASAGDAIVSAINKTLGSTTWQGGGGGGGGGGITDGDKGDITVSGSGATWTIDNDVVTFAKLQNISQNNFIGRTSAGSGDPQQVSASQARTILSINNVDNTSDLNKPISTATSTALAGKANTSHTHSISDITNFNEVVEDTIGTKIIAGTNVTVSYNDISGETIISASGGGNVGFTDVVSDVETDFYYYGGLLNGVWKINRYSKADINIKLTADIVNNPSFADINIAWTNRTTLVYT